MRKIDEIKSAIYSLLQNPTIRKSASAFFFASRPAPSTPRPAPRAPRPAPRFVQTTVSKPLTRKELIKNKQKHHNRADLLLRKIDEIKIAIYTAPPAKSYHSEIRLCLLLRLAPSAPLIYHLSFLT